MSENSEAEILLHMLWFMICCEQPNHEKIKYDGNNICEIELQ